jgi:Carboxypeptidase regulatory-like domain/TonB dependent receptor
MNARRVTILGLMVVLPSLAQTFGEIDGLVTDSSGSLVTGARVTITNRQTGLTRNTISNNAGNYNFPDLPPGPYDVKAEMTGFQTEVRGAVELQVQQTARIDFRLNVGAVTETVQVEAGAPLLNTEDATVGTVIEEQRILDLPLNGRSFVDLIALSPNVTTGQTSTGGFASVRGGSARGDVSLAIAGSRREFVYYSLDGVSNTEMDWDSYALLPSIDALQEFKVQTGTYPADFGFESGQVNVSTRGGTNEYHGAIFEFLRNNHVDARPFAFTTLVPSTAPFKWNQYGFTLGGPISIPKVFNGKNRLFFMSNFEGFKLRQQAQELDSVPTAAMRSGNLSALLPNTVIKDPLNNNLPFPGNIIPTNRLDPIAQRLLAYDPLPNIPGAGLVNNYLELNNDPSNNNQFTQRIDWIESSKSSWFGRFSWEDDSLVDAGAFAEALNVTDNVKQAMISNTRILSPNVVNEFHFGSLDYHNLLGNPLAFKENVTADVGIQLLTPVPPAAWGIPIVATTPFTDFGDDLQGPWDANEQTFQWIDNLNWTHGKHTIKMGMEVRRDRYDEAGNQQLRGEFAFQGAVTGYGFGDYLLGYTSRAGEDVGGIAVGQFRRTDLEPYITDSWKIRPNLTLEIGLRYEFDPVWNSRADDFANIIIPQFSLQPNFQGPQPYMARDCEAYGQSNFYPPGLDVRFNPGINVACVNGMGSTLMPNDHSDFAPRLGLAWSPGPNWSVRAGFGIFYAQDEGNAFFDATKNLFTQLTTTASGSNLTSYTIENPLGPPTANTCGTTFPLVCTSSPVIFENDPHYKTPYVAEYEVSIQRQLTGSTVLEIGYLGSQGHRLEAHLSYNNVQPGPGTIASRSPYPEYANILPTLGIASSAYNSATVKLTHRLASGLSALLSYTFSKSIDDSSSINPESGPAAGVDYGDRQPQTGWCITCEMSLSDFDTRHRLVASVLYQLPFGPGKKFLDHGIASKTLGGWQVNSIVSISSGFPMTVYDGSNISNSNVDGDRPNAVVGVSPQLSNPTTSEWFNIAAFQEQPLYTFGNVGRNTVIGPGVFGWDFSTLKNFYINERAYFQFRFECFNCDNHARFGDPNTVLDLNSVNAAGFAIPNTGNFGTITTLRSGLDMREMQFSLKFYF